MKKNCAIIRYVLIAISLLIMCCSGKDRRDDVVEFQQLFQTLEDIGYKNTTSKNRIIIFPVLGCDKCNQNLMLQLSTLKEASELTAIVTGDNEILLNGVKSVFKGTIYDRYSSMLKSGVISIYPRYFNLDNNKINKSIELRAESFQSNLEMMLDDLDR